MPDTKEQPTRSDNMNMTALENALAPLGISIFKFETLLNKSWSLILRRNELLVRFVYDGRDDFILVEETDYVPSNKSYLWHSTFVPKVDVDEVREPFRYIEECLKKKFETELSPNRANTGRLGLISWLKTFFCKS
jgi:hypothetical protein